MSMCDYRVDWVCGELSLRYNVIERRYCESI